MHACTCVHGTKNNLDFVCLYIYGAFEKTINRLLVWCTYICIKDLLILECENAHEALLKLQHLHSISWFNFLAFSFSMTSLLFQCYCLPATGHLVKPNAVHFAWNFRRIFHSILHGEHRYGVGFWIQALDFCILVKVIHSQNFHFNIFLFCRC